MIGAHEVERNLVVRFDPATLLKHGANPSGPPAFAVQGVHYFLCLGRCGPASVWVPAFSRQTSGRIKLRWKGGNSDWVEWDSYVDASQMWVIPDEAIGPASMADRTKRGQRNHASAFFLFDQYPMAQAG